MRKQLRTMQIGSKLRKLRIAQKLSQRDVAEQLEVSPSTYNAWESDASEPKPSQLVELAEIFGTDITDFFPNDAKVQIIHHQDNKGINGVVVHTENSILREKIIQHLEEQLADKNTIIRMQEEKIGFLQQITSERRCDSPSE